MLPTTLLDQAWYRKAPRLPEPAGEVLEVGTTDELYRAARDVRPGGTILLADGRYTMPDHLLIQSSGVTLRGASGDRLAAVVDFNGRDEGIAISYCTDVTIADLTVENARQNGIKINSNHGVHRVAVHNVVGHNIWQRHVKGVAVPFEDGKAAHVLDCRVQYCLFYNDRVKRRGDDPYEDSTDHFGFNYIGGMDIMGAKGWTISDNVFVNIHGKTGEARGAIFIWNGSEDCVIERNVIIDCDSGICMGNGHRAMGDDGKPVWPIHDTRVIARNNFIAGHNINVGILAEYTNDCNILNNTLHDSGERSQRLIRVAQDSDGLVVMNNLVSGRAICIDEHTGRIKVENNLENPAPEYFVDPANGDLRLTEKAAEAIGKALQVGDPTDRPLPPQ